MSRFFALLLLCALLLAFHSGPGVGEPVSGAVEVRETVVHDFGSATPFDKSYGLIICVSPDNRRVAYAARLDQPEGSGKLGLFVDGIKVGECEKALDAYFSENSQSYAFAFADAGGEFVLSNGRAYGPYTGVMPRSVLLDDSGTLAFVVRLDDGKQALIYNGAEEAFHDEITEVVISSGAKHPSYIFRDGTAYSVSFGGRSYFKAERIESLALSPIGRGACYSVLDNGRWFPWLERRKGPFCDGIVGGFTYSPDGKSIAWIGKEGANTVLYVGSDKTPFTSVRSPVFSPDGNRLAFVVVDKQSQNIKLCKVSGNSAKLGGAHIKGHDFVTGMWFSPDSARFVHTCTMTHMEVMIENGKFDAEYHDVIEPVFSGDSSTVAFAARFDNRLTLVVNGKTFASWQADYAYNLAVSPKGSNHAFMMSKDGKHILMINGVERANYSVTLYPELGKANPRYDADAVRRSFSSGRDMTAGKRHSAIIFDDEQSFHTITFRDNKLLLVNCTIKGK